jgi:NAD(P)-dependent dehydrogenase (short-subunit alcohol dehydrogenase family)
MASMDHWLPNRVAVITGAAGGLGSALARHFASQGASLALLGRERKALEELASTLPIAANKVFTHAVDLLDPGAARQAADAVSVHFGRIDILVHVVGGWVGGKTIVDTAREDLAAMLNQHVWTSFNATRAFVPHMVASGYGRVVMITSPAGARPNAKGGAYAIGKAGQEALMLTLSQELKGTGVTANVLQVKMIDVERQKVSAPSPENASWTTPEELAGAIHYLVSGDGSAVNGAKIPLFGAYS